MNPISSAQTILRDVYAPASPQAAGAASTAPGAPADDKVSHTTRISQAGRALSRHGQGAQASSAQGSTIEALREALLERIRQLQEQLARKQQELAALAADDVIPASRKEALLHALSSEIRALNTALATTQGHLLKLEQKNLQQRGL